MAPEKIPEWYVPFGELKPADPSLRDRTNDFVGGLLGGGKGDYAYAKKVTGALDFVPGAGTALAADDARADYARGDYVGAGVNAAAAGLDVVPGVGGAAAAGLKTLPAIFAGVAAKRAPKKKIAKALKVLSKGEDKARVWRGLGVGEEPVSKKPVWEIDDSAARLKPEARAAKRVGDAIDHPELFDNYPDLADVPMVYRGGGDEETVF